MEKQPEKKPFKELWIIEAKGKISTLDRVLTQMGRSVKVWSTNGHFLAMPKTLKPLGIDANFRDFLREPMRIETIEWLRSLASEAQSVFVATDNDTEGHVIAWDVAEMIADIHPDPVRVRMRCMDEEAIKQALEESSPVLKEDAIPGRTRAIIDRLIGGVFSGGGVKVGRIKTAMLGSIAKNPPTVLRLNLNAPAKDRGRPWLASVDVKPPLTRSLAEKLAALRLPELSFLEPDLEKPVSDQVKHLPNHMGNIMISASEQLDIAPKEVARALQITYEAGRMSYPRAGSNGMSKSAALRMKKAFARSGFVFDDKKVPDKPDEEPHDAPYPIGSVDVNFNPNKLGTDEGVRVIVARELVKVGQTHRAEKPLTQELVSFLIKQGFSAEIADYVANLDWNRFVGPSYPGKTSWSESCLVERRQDSVLLEHMLNTGLGRPSTWANHVDGFLKEGLVNNDFKLTEKGKEWIRNSPPLLVDERIPIKIEKACEHISAQLFSDTSREPWEVLAEKIITALPAQLQKPLLDAALTEAPHAKRDFRALVSQGIDFDQLKQSVDHGYTPEFAKD